MASGDSCLSAQERKKLIFFVLSEVLDDSLETMVVDNILQTTSTVFHAWALECDEEERDPSAHVENYVEEVVPRYRDVQFKEHFRMRRDTFQALCDWLGPHFPQERTLTVEKKLLASIWLVSNKESFRGVADRFGLNKGTLHRIVMMVCRLISDHRGDVIHPPTNIEFRQYAEQFEDRCGFPGVVGAVDGTHISIPGPSKHRDSFINRKGFPSMQLQVVCNAKLLFWDVYTGWPGSVHDCRVFRNSPLKTYLETKLPSQYHLLGDAAYQLSPHLLTPFRENGHLTAVEKQYNKAHSSTRVDVERAIGLLKGKFRRLKYLEMFDVGSMPFVIFAACALHNFIILKNGVDEEDIETDDDADNSGNCEDVQNRAAQCALDKRIEIAHLLL